MNNLYSFNNFNLIKENKQNLPLFIVDIQKMYGKGIWFDIEEFYNFLTEYKGEIVFFYNDMDDDGTNNEVIQYFIDNIDSSEYYDDEDDHIEDDDEDYKEEEDYEDYNGKDEEISRFFDMNVKFVLKNYGFFREVMDDIEDSDIAIIYKYMLSHDISDSSEINLEIFLEEFGEEISFDKDEMRDIIKYSAIQQPECGNEEFTQNGIEVNICGGGQHECLREVEILLDANNITYNEINEYIY